MHKPLAPLNTLLRLPFATVEGIEEGVEEEEDVDGEEEEEGVEEEEEEENVGEVEGGMEWKELE